MIDDGADLGEWVEQGVANEDVVDEFAAAAVVAGVALLDGDRIRVANRRPRQLASAAIGWR